MGVIKDLWFGMNYETGRFSHTKLWGNIANLTATFIMIKLTYMSQLTENYFLIYLGVVASHQVASKFLNLKKTDVINKENNN